MEGHDKVRHKGYEGDSEEGDCWGTPADPIQEHLGLIIRYTPYEEGVYWFLG